MTPATRFSTSAGVSSALLRRWVADGGEYQGHWALTPPRRPAAPDVRKPLAASRNAIDRFSRDHDCSPGELVSFLDTVLVLNVPGWRATAIDRPDGSILIGIRRA